MLKLTSFLQNLQDYEVEKAALATKLPALKKSFEAYITDKDISLTKRWSAFQDAHDELKNHSNWMISDDIIAFEYIREHWFDAPETYGRGKRIDLAETIDNRCGYNDDGTLHAEDGFDAYKGQTPAQLAESAMEEVLRLNLGSFCWDW